MRVLFNQIRTTSMVPIHRKTKNNCRKVSRNRDWSDISGTDLVYKNLLIIKLIITYQLLIALYFHENHMKFHPSAVTHCAFVIKIQKFHYYDLIITPLFHTNIQFHKLSSCKLGRHSSINPRAVMKISHPKTAAHHHNPQFALHDNLPIDFGASDDLMFRPSNIPNPT